MNNKKHYYVAVLLNTGLRFVTGTNNTTKTAFWKKGEKPVELSKSYAEDIAYCLNLNFTPAIVVSSFYELSKEYNQI